MGVFPVCLIGMWFFWLLIDVWYPVFQLQGWQSLLQHRVQGEFHGRWDGRRWTHDISSCTSEHLTFGQWSNFPTDPLSENQQQLDMVVSEVLSEVNKLQPWMWSCLRSCCLKILFVRLTSPIDFFVLRTWILIFFGGLWRMTISLVILLSWSERGVCVSELEFGCLDLIFSGCRMFDASVTIVYLNLCFQYVFRKGNGKLWYQ